MALPAGAAAASHRAPGEGPLNVPLSCMITNLLASPFTYWRSLLSKWTGAQRAGSGARMMPFRRARRFQRLRLLTASDQWLRRGTSDVLCATSVSCYHGNVSRQREDDVAWGRAAPGNTGGFNSARRASLSLHPNQQGGAQPSLLYYHENKP